MQTLIQLVLQGQGRIVSTADLNEFQIAEASSNGTLFIDQDGFGFVMLPWQLTTKKDRERERAFFTERGISAG